MNSNRYIPGSPEWMEALVEQRKNPVTVTVRGEVEASSGLRLDISSGGWGGLSIFPSRSDSVGIYVKDDDGPAVFYANKSQVRLIIDMLEKLIK